MSKNLLLFEFLLEVVCLQQCLSMKRLILKNDLLINIPPLSGLCLRMYYWYRASASDYSPESAVKRLTGGLLRLVGLHQSIRRNNQRFNHILENLFIFQTVASGDVSDYFLMESVETSL